ncbi:MAG: SEL1-like repeat protein [Opitutaceae bacterium]|nr:SEL1-like repeat protein [Opitutaceae bacterium]
MIRGFPIRATATLALAAFAPLVCANPYQTRLDRQYQSLSRSIERAYSPPPPRPTYTPPTRSYSSSPPSSSSSYSSRSSGSSSSSTSSWSTRSDSVNRFAEDKRQLEAKFAAQAKARKLSPAEAKRAADAKKAADAKQAAAAKAAAERRAEIERALQRHQPSRTPAEWAAFRTETHGKAPLAAPPRSALESRRAEFAHYAAIARARGAAAPWENLRVGQLSLLFQGDGAEPAKALAFFQHADPAWPETQLGLGLCYLRGFGTAPDPEKARAHLERAASTVAPAHAAKGYRATGELFPSPVFHAAHQLGVAYDLGQGLPADPLLALRWYQHAEALPLTPGERENVQALLREYWKKHAGRAREVVQRDLAAGGPGATGRRVASEAVLAHLVAAKDAAALFELGDAVDTKDANGAETTDRRNGAPYFLAAAQLGHEPAARAWFSPAKNGVYFSDLGGDWSRAESAQFAQEQWPAWEKKFLAAAAAGDATAHIPLAFHYSGARGNPGNSERFKHHIALLPAAMPAAQRRAILNGPETAAWHDLVAWIDKTVLPALGGTALTVDLRKLKLPADSARGAALREEGIALAATDPKAARDRIRDAAALGDLPAQVQLWRYADSSRHHLGSNYSVSLRARLEEAAAAGDRGAMAALGVWLASFWTGSTDEASAWRAKVRTLAPHKAAFARIVAEPSLTDEQADALRAAALAETAQWRADARKWGLTGTDLVYDLTLTDEAVSRSDDLRRQYVGLAAAAPLAAAQLPLWEATVEAGDFNPEADARMMQGLLAWLGDDDERDLPAAFDALTESAALGHPLAPLALGYFFGSGHGGFPKDVALAKRCRALADARLTALAEDGDGWAQAMLGGLLTEGVRAEADDPRYPSIYAWLPHDAARGRAWLRTAALAGHALPEFFGNSQGRPVAWAMIGHAENEAEEARWKLIDDVFTYCVAQEGPEAEADFDRAVAKAREIINESPATSLARKKLEHAVDQADTDAEQSAARAALARAMLAAGLPKIARINAGIASRTTSLDPAGWLLRAEVETACGAAQFAATCRAFAGTLTRDSGAPERFAAALAQLNEEDQGEFRLVIDGTLEEAPQSAPLKELKAILDRVAPAK